ncbi:hypothetical protein ACIOHC_36395 [Streptomyces sp. NPDC088252]|uniref:hypothetical protein n=1 Tax=Streptomyces sp. NPDC088252 TaxID=3365845 RepID=UPI00380F9856
MTSERVRRGEKASATVEEILELVQQDASNLKTIPHVARGIEGMTRGIPFSWPPDYRNQLSQADLISVADRVGEIAAVELWKRNGRVAYDLNEELAAALYKSKIGKMPGSLFDRLPHINPMVVIPDPWPVTDPSSNVRGEVRAFFVTGYTGDAFCNTTNPDRDGIAIMFWMERTNLDTGEVQPGQGAVIFFPTFKDAFTLDDVVKVTEEWHSTPGREMDVNTSKKILRQIVPPALSILAYLCCDNRDIEEPVIRAKRKKRAKAKPRDPFYIRLGWHIGPALHEARRRFAGRSKDGIAVPSGAEYGPQHRAGHFKRVWTGPGKKREEVVWVEPYWTKLDMLAENEDPPTMVVPVNEQRHDPMRRRDLKK